MPEMAPSALDSPTVSVVLPTHNRAGSLRPAIDSVLGQSYENLELIVVDDASVDHTRQLVDGLGDPRVRYLRHDDNRGAPAARNTGIQAARGTYVAFQDSDDVWKTEKLAKQMAAIDTAQDPVDVIYCGYVMRSAGRDRYIPDRRIGLREGEILPQLLSGNIVGTPTLVARRTILQEIGGFDETLGRFQDWDLAVRLAAVARFRLVDEPLVVAYCTPGSISTNDAAGAEALRIMLRTHADQYERHPHSKASALAGLGHLECLVGDMGSGRGHLIESLAIRPGSLGTVAALLLSLLGRSVYRFGSTTRRSFGSARTAAPAIAAAERSN